MNLNTVWDGSVPFTTVVLAIPSFISRARRTVDDSAEVFGGFVSRNNSEADEEVFSPGEMSAVGRSISDGSYNGFPTEKREESHGFPSRDQSFGSGYVDAAEDNDDFC